MKTVIEMAREAGAIRIHKSPKEFALVGNEAIERFAELVRADEREACANVCDDLPALERMSLDNEALYECATLDCSNAIRARSST